MGNSPINVIDPDGGWEPDKNGNLVAEAGDDIMSLQDYFGGTKTFEEVSDIFYNSGNWDATGLTDITGHTLTLDNVFTQSISVANANPSFELSKNYNCWGSTWSGIKRLPMKGIDFPMEFDTKLQQNFTNVSQQNMVWGETAVRFAESNPYADAMYTPYVQAGLLSRNPQAAGGTSHGAVFYGKNKAGEIYVYTKNGWYARPYVTKLSNLIHTVPSYGQPTGMGGGSPYYRLK